MADLPRTLVITGVSGSGKSTVARDVAARTGAVLLDADDFHPVANVAKMASGRPLTDADRGPWVDALADELRRRAARGERVVLACSALRRRHRERLRDAADDVAVVHLDVGRERLERRLAGRSGHFMPAELLESQLADLDPPDPTRTVVVDADLPVTRVVDEVLQRLGGAGRRGGSADAGPGPAEGARGPWSGGARRAHHGDMGTDRATTATTVDHQGLEILSTERCWELLAETPVGRVAYLEAGDVMILPVNHAVVGHHIVFRTLRGSLLHEALMREPVAFEVDGFDPASQTGWSVVARGIADLADEPGSGVDVDLVPWADGVERDDWVRVQVDEISGRRIPPRT